MPRYLERLDNSDTVDHHHHVYWLSRTTAARNSSSTTSPTGSIRLSTQRFTLTSKGDDYTDGRGPEWYCIIIRPTRWHRNIFSPYTPSADLDLSPVWSARRCAIALNHVRNTAQADAMIHIDSNMPINHEYNYLLLTRKNEPWLSDIILMLFPFSDL